MQVETLPSNSNDETIVLKTLFKNISPLGYKVRALIEHKVITNLEEIDSFKQNHEGQEDYVDDVINEMVDKGFIRFSDNQVVVLKPVIWEKNDHEKMNKSLPEIFRQVSKKALEDRASGDFDKFLDFAFVLDFANEPETNKKAAAIIAACAQELAKLSKMTSSNDKNDGIRVLTFAGSTMDAGGEK